MPINLITQIKWTHSLNKYNLPNSPNFTKEKIDIMNRPISIKNIESLINNLPKQKAPGPDEFTSKLYQTFKEEIV